MESSMLWNSGEVQKVRMRLKREECRRTKHDSVFSRWEILIGPNDWKDHDSGKDGVERYRIHNLPSASSCPGLYELGLASIPANEGRRVQKSDFDNVIVAYLGQADNVRTRLQEYGRSGSHLDHGHLVSFRENYEISSLKGGYGLFKDVFSKGYSILFRWAPIKSKTEAEKTEIELLGIFDYAWNRKGNGLCRHADIIAKLIHNSSNSGHNPLRRLIQWKQEVFSRRVGINIDSNTPFFVNILPPHGLKGYFLHRIFKFSSSYLHILPQATNSANDDRIICGVATGHGLVCLNRPLPERKRCAAHKGRKITSLGSSSTQKSAISSDILIDGAKECELDIEGKLTSPVSDEICSPFQQHQPWLAEEKFHKGRAKNGVCGVVCGDGSMCRRRPVSGRRRCERHKGKRVVIALKKIDKTYNICGVLDDDGHACSRLPVHGRKRCEEHRGRRLVVASKRNV